MARISAEIHQLRSPVRWPPSPPDCLLILATLFGLMGCCASSAVAAESDIPPPTWGQSLKVQLKKKGMFSSDYKVLTGGPNLDGSKDGEEWCVLALYLLGHAASRSFA